MVGIVDFEVGFPQARITVGELHESSGHPVEDILALTLCEAIPVFGADEPAWELLSDVAAKVLDRTAVPPAEIGQVVVAGSGEWDFPAWSPAAKIADELGVVDAHCFELVNFCAASATAIQTAADAIAAGRVRYSLLLFGERASRGVDYTDPESLPLFNTGDCAVAVLLGRDDPAFELLCTHATTDPRWCDHYVGEYEEGRVVTRRRGRQMHLPRTYLRNYEALTRRALSTLDMTVADLRYLLVNHMDRRIHERLLHHLGLSTDRSVFNYARFGHMGCGDPFIALADLLAANKLQDGDRILFATSGTGFTWAVTALRYHGPAEPR